MNTPNTRHHKLVCSIDPTTRGLAFSVMEGPQDLLDWGAAESRIAKHRRCLRKISELFAHYQPQILVLERDAASGLRRSNAATRLIDEAIRLAKAQGMTVATYPRGDVREVFKHFKARTKHEIALAVAKWFPELEPMLPRKRKPWMGEDDRMNVFDAIALCLAHYYFTE